VAGNENASPVLIAYDGSDFAKAAIAEAGNQLAAGRRAIVLTVSEPLSGIPFFGAAGVPVEPETIEGLFDAAREGAQKVAEEGAWPGRPVSMPRRWWLSAPPPGARSSRPPTSRART
jgi:hypothetical protein